ncbi:54S ribosomal protein L4 mitochondrial [Rhinocladiella similis]
MTSLAKSFSPCSTSVPVFLAPAFARPAAPTAIFSRTYASKPKRNKAHQIGQAAGGEKNKQRGVSAIRRTGPRTTQGLWMHPLPVPVARDHRGTDAQYAGSDNHGLWGFFNAEKKPMLPPDVESSHGRSWTYTELAQKSYDDLHKLYWVCVKEQNVVMTREKERKRLRAGYGVAEHEERVKTIRKTMYQIRNVLADRQLSWEDARMLYGQGNMEDMLAPPDQKAGDEMADFEDYGEPIQDVGGSSVDGADKKPFHEPRL